MNKTILLLLFYIISYNTVGQTIEQPLGDGSKENPYQIASFGNLLWMSEKAKTTSFWEYFVQTANIDASVSSTINNGAGFMPIGTPMYPFIGNYNGKGHIISNLFIRRPSTDFVGLFGDFRSGNLDSLHLVNIDFTGIGACGLISYATGCQINNCSITGKLGGGHGAGLITTAYNTTVKDCEVNVIASFGSNYSTSGGLIATATTSKIQNCQSAGSITGYVYIGGLIGRCEEQSQITHCNSSANVSYIGDSYGIGGLIGELRNSTVSECYAEGKVNGGGLTSGGLVGINNGTITRSFSSGSISGLHNTGGFVGENKGTISHSYTKSNISTVYGGYYGGGFAGVNSGIILNCYCVNTVKGYYFTGGFIGNNEGTVENCYNSNSISAQYPFAGFIYYNTNLAIKNCFWDKTIATKTTTMSGTAVTTIKAQTSDQMKDKANFITASWDYTNEIENGTNDYWTQSSLINSGYPFFPWQTIRSVFETNSATNITTTTALLNGSFTDKGWPDASEIGFCWSLSENPTKNDSVVVISSPSMSFAAQITKLKPNSKYYVRAFAVQEGITIFSSQISFTTYPETPSTKIEIPLDITAINATLSGEIVFSGSSEVSEVGFCWNQTGEPTTSDNFVRLGAISSNYFYQLISNLKPSTTYYIRAYAINASGIGYSNTIIINTLPRYPIVTCQEATDITGESVSISGIITSAGASNVKVCGFCWSLQDSPTLRDFVAPKDVSMETGGFSIPIEKLKPFTTYYIKAFAINDTDTSYSQTVSFKTVWEGKGTVTNPYKISTPEDIYLLSKSYTYLNSVFILTNDINMAISKTWNNGSGLTPIGPNGSGFTGIFKGQGYCLKNLYINYLYSYSGFFAMIDGAKIDSLGIVGISITGSSIYTGGLVGKAFSGIITNCYTTGKITCNSIVGGLVGENRATIRNCYSTCQISATKNAGGLIGINYGDVKHSYSVGKISCSTNSGGLVGTANGGTIGDCYWDITTSGKNNGVSSASTYYGTNIGLPTPKIKNKVYLTNFDFENTWVLRADSTYPALKNMRNNAPFAFSDTVMTPKTIALAKLLKNDFDYENIQNRLTVKVLSQTNSSLVNDTLILSQALKIGDTAKITYYIGEVIAANDTAWGNIVNSFIVKTDKYTPKITWNITTPITCSAPLDSSVFTANADCDGIFKFSHSIGDTLDTGNHEIISTFYPVDSSNISISSKSISVNVTPLIHSIPLEEGWNLISTYLQPADSSIMSITTYTNITEIKTMSEYWRKGQDAVFNTLNYLNAGSGYFALCTKRDTLDIIGCLSQNLIEQKKSNSWQLIGNPLNKTVKISETPELNKFSIIKNFEGFWIRNEDKNGFDSISPSKGYLTK